MTHLLILQWYYASVVFGNDVFAAGRRLHCEVSVMFSTFFTRAHSYRNKLQILSVPRWSIQRINRYTEYSI